MPPAGARGRISRLLRKQARGGQSVCTRCVRLVRPKGVEGQEGRECGAKEGGGSGEVLLRSCPARGREAHIDFEVEGWGVREQGGPQVLERPPTGRRSREPRLCDETRVTAVHVRALPVVHRPPPHPTTLWCRWRCESLANRPLLALDERRVREGALPLPAAPRDRAAAPELRPGGTRSAGLIRDSVSASRATGPRISRSRRSRSSSSCTSPPTSTAAAPGLTPH